MARPVGCRDKRAQGTAVEAEHRSGLDRAEAKFRAGRTPTGVEAGFVRDVATGDNPSLAYGLCTGPDIGPLNRNAVDLAEGPRRQARIDRCLEGRHTATGLYSGVAHNCVALEQLGKCTRCVQRFIRRPDILVYQTDEK